MSRLDQLTKKYARGGRVSTPHALAAVQRAMAHVERGDHQAAMAELAKSPDAMAHPQVQAAMATLAPQPRMAEGGPVERAQGTSSPGSPGVSGAIKDAIAAARDYFVDVPRREIQAQREQSEDAYINHGEPGYAEGGKVTQVKAMAKFMAEKLGIPDVDAHRLAREYHASTQSPVSPVVQKLAADMAARPPMGGVKKPPQQLAQELAAGHVDPQELQHLLYTDPTLTPLINRYQSGVDNQNLTPQ